MRIRRNGIISPPTPQYLSVPTLLLDAKVLIGYSELMCAHVTTVTWDELLAVARAMWTYTPIIDIPDWPARPPRYADAFPKSVVPVLLSAVSRETMADTGEAARALFAEPSELVWGYSLEGKSDVIFNTRVETAATSPLWRSSFADRHCVVPVHTFFEPHKTERIVSPRGKELKQVYSFEESDSPVMLLAGIWDQDRFSILTTEPNEYVAPVHNRMPIVLDQKAAMQWLTFQGLATNENIPLTSSPVYPNEPPTPTSGQQLTLF